MFSCFTSRQLASGSYKEIKIWDIDTGEEIKTFVWHKKSVSCLVILPNGFLASGSCDGRIKI